MTKPNKAQFQEYVEISDRGVSNLFDGECICKESKTGLTVDMCRCINKHFTELSEEFNVRC